MCQTGILDADDSLVIPAWTLKVCKNIFGLFLEVLRHSVLNCWGPGIFSQNLDILVEIPDETMPTITSHRKILLAREDLP